MLFCKNDKKIYHIHIPRTGGRYIRELFVKNSFDFYYSDFYYSYKGVEIPHLHYPLYLDLEFVEESEHFTLVRNPFEKFKSVMQTTIRVRGYSEEIYNLIKDKDWLFNFLDMERDGNSYITNYFRKQSDFVSEKTKIWKLEDNLDQNFVDWLNKNLNIELKNFDDIVYHKAEPELIPIKQEVCSSIKELIKEYYAEDYEKFNY